jgi:outer membrane protein TolC
MKKLIGIVLLIMLFHAGVVCAGEEVVFRWGDCVREALRNNPELMSAQETIRQSEADKRITEGDILPQISAELEGSTSETADAQSQSDFYSYSVTGRQLVFDGFKTSKDVNRAKEGIRASRYNYAVVSSNVRLALRTAFVELLRSQQLISLTENIAIRRKQNLELVKLRYEAGREHKGSLLTAEADMAHAEFEIIQAQRSISLARRQLLKGLGFKEVKPIKVEGEFSLRGYYGAKPDLAFLADNTPFLKELIVRKDAARFNLDSARADFFPKVFLSGSLGRASSGWPPEHDEWSAGISLSLPLYEGGSRLSEVTKARSRVRQAEAAERSGRDSVLVTLEDTWKNLQDAISSLSVQKKFLNAAEERAKIARAQYETGQISFDDWIIIEGNLVNARKSFLSAQAGVMLAEANWTQARGGTLEHDQE